MHKIDGNLKITFLIFLSSFFDFIEFIIVSFLIPHIAKISQTADLRLSGMQTISSALLFKYALRLKIEKHQTFSLIIIGICLVLISVIEFIYERNIALFEDLFLSYILTYLSIILISFNDLIEKYLTYFDFMEPMLLLVIESIFGFIMVSIFTIIFPNFFKDMKEIFNGLETGKIILLIFLLFIYFALSAGLNVYKLFCNTLYSPMYKSIAIYILNPIMIVYSFFFMDDFIYEGEQNVLYLVLNIILAIIVLFSGAVYNEFIILYCWRLEYETYQEITNRAKTMELINIKDVYFDMNEDKENLNDGDNDIKEEINKDNEDNNEDNGEENPMNNSEEFIFENKEYYCRKG